MMGDEDSLKLLKNKRGTIKAKITRFKSYIETIEQTKDVRQLQDRFKHFEDCLSNFDDIQTQIEIMCENPDEVDNERELFEDSYYELSARAKELLPFCILKDTSPSQNSIASTIPQTPALVKLPSIDLPKFCGNYEDWSSFSDLFTSLIHNNNSLSDVEKFYYLKTSLAENVKPILSSLEASADNYITAWELLKERYDNKRIIVNKHISSMVNFTPLSKESAFGIMSLLDTINKHTRCLGTLGLPVDQWDSILLFLIVKKLDPTTLKHWENANTSKELPTMENFKKFLQSRCQVLEFIDGNRPESFNTHKTTLNPKFTNKPRLQPISNHQHRAVISAHVAAKPQCYLCHNSYHKIYKCPRFLTKSVPDRIGSIKSLNLCANCFNPGHINTNCRSGSCRICRQKHNTLIHINQSYSAKLPEGIPILQSASSPNTSSKTSETVSLASQTTSTSQQVLLSTAIVYVTDKCGYKHPCRALLDSGSQTHFMTNRMAQILNLKRTSSILQIKGINQTPSQSMGAVNCTITSRCTSYTRHLEFQVVPSITQEMPNVTFSTNGWEIPNWIQLADPEFNVSGKIDMLIGGELFFDLLCVGQFNNGPGTPVLQKTLLGWIAGGQVRTQTQNLSSQCLHITTERLESKLTKFWELEEIDKSSNTSDDKLCETHYEETTTRDDSGRYTVSLPLKSNIQSLGDSYGQAVTRLQSTERKLKRNPNLRTEYNKFMNEYLSLNHMEPVLEEVSEAKTYYLPHLPVIRESSSTTKLRVVFDASAKTTSGLSLNDAMYVGPTIQADLFTTICNFRTYKYAMSADVAKMYRQILLNQNQRDLQRVLWRFNPEKEIQIYRLRTVTYGMAAAPYLAIRTLQKLALDEQHRFPNASKVLLEDFYVDDMMAGAADLDTALALQEELIALLHTGGFELRKWSANHSDLLSSIPEQHREIKSDLITDSEHSVKVLGMLWNSNQDYFHFQVKKDFIHPVTKRTNLSDIAGLFDPLGLLGPVISKAKILLQTLWSLKVGWDESLPQSIHESWKKYRMDLNKIETVRVPRRITPGSSVNITLHGFCDASEVAYGACIYARQETSEGDVQVSLICAKSRVAPLKKQTIPRLELCGALLLSRLLSKIRRMKIKCSEFVLWCDSSIVLTWIKAEPSAWKVFVSNRVQEIKTLTADCSWKHVSSKDNPADLISRGLMPNQIVLNDFWWHGPVWLRHPEIKWPTHEFIEEVVPERRTSPTQPSTLVCQKDQHNEIIMNPKDFSNLHKLKRVTAYCMRFIGNCKNPAQKQGGALTVQELNKALHYLVKKDQELHFPKEIKAISSSNENSKHNLKSLRPFIDNEGLLRVGGRLENAEIASDQKHPIILAKSHLTDLIIRHEHYSTHHSGPQLLLATIRQQFWPIGGRNATKKIVRGCVDCFKAKPRSEQPCMGDIPANRLKPSRPFSKTGIDYCGPIYIKSANTRKAKIIKCYIAVFVCFSTKALHIELVHDLTTDAFLAAFKRFISRRGISMDVYSDNGTNFIGAFREIQELRRLLQSQEHQRKTVETAAALNISWHFIPPRSPHFGGLWEAGVKSIKHHLKRVVKNAHLTYEQMYTVLTMVEACLNSRPLTPLSNDPSDPTPLTPGHFLIGEALTALPEPDITHLRVNRLSQWQRSQQILQHFWSRWSKEYLSLLQQRQKWSSGDCSLLPGQVVLVKEDNLPPLKWLSAVVMDTHPGADGKCRVATIKTPSGTYKRAVNKLCPLPIDYSA